MKGGRRSRAEDARLPAGLRTSTQAPRQVRAVRLTFGCPERDRSTTFDSTAVANGRIEWLLGGARGSREATIYVKGFLFGGERPEVFDPWVESHRRLAPHGWEGSAAGWIWQSGGLTSLPVPVAAATRLAWDVYRSTRLARSVAILPHVGFALAEVAGRFLAQYAYAARVAAATAAGLASVIRELRHAGTDVRLVAHSLGCWPAIHASTLLHPDERPREIHLLAPACVEDELGDRLDRLARQRTYVFYSPTDPVLALGFRAVALRSALGAVGPRRSYSGLVAVDASPRLRGLRTHGDYKHRLAELVAALEASAGEDQAAFATAPVRA
jgi:hypothetical protein